MFQHILVPTDFGEPAAAALDVAIELAKRFGARITLLHSYQVFVPVAYAETFSWPVEQIADAARNTLNAQVARAKERYANVEGVLRSGNPSDEIVAVASDAGADLIVMGTHGRRGVPRFMMGSVAERVTRTSPVPVMTVPAMARAERKQPS